MPPSADFFRLVSLRLSATRYNTESRDGSGSGLLVPARLWLARFPCTLCGADGRLWRAEECCMNQGVAFGLARSARLIRSLRVRFLFLFPGSTGLNWSTTTSLPIHPFLVPTALFELNAGRFSHRIVRSISHRIINDCFSPAFSLGRSRRGFFEPSISYNLIIVRYGFSTGSSSSMRSHRPNDTRRER